MSEISKLTELRKLMQEMEHSMGLQDLSSVERDIYYAATDLTDTPFSVNTSRLFEHALVADVSRPTFFRALKTLVYKGYLSHCSAAGRGWYVVELPK